MDGYFIHGLLKEWNLGNSSHMIEIIYFMPQNSANISELPIICHWLIGSSHSLFKVRYSSRGDT